MKRGHGRHLVSPLYGPLQTPQFPPSPLLGCSYPVTAPSSYPAGVTHSPRGDLHHVELWVPDLVRACEQWGWLLSELGYVQFQDWEHGRSWLLGGTYLVIEQSPALSASDHDRLRPGVNHLAFHAGSRASVDALAAAGPAHGWTLLFPQAHPHAGGQDHYAAYLTNTDGFEVELVANPPGPHDGGQ
jgi:catechol 2,3-dioxygenase-like lactoylglutathione lyase family enzyme